MTVGRWGSVRRRGSLHAGEGVSKKGSGAERREKVGLNGCNKVMRALDPNEL